MLDTSVLVALVAAVPATIAATASWSKSRKTNITLRGNGMGTHTQMLELAVRGINELKDWTHDHESKHSTTISQLSQIADLQAAPSIPIPLGSRLTITPPGTDERLN